MAEPSVHGRIHSVFQKASAARSGTELSVLVLAQFKTSHHSPVHLIRPVGQA